MDLTELLGKLYNFVPEPLQEPLTSVLNIVGGATPLVGSALNLEKLIKN